MPYALEQADILIDLAQQTLYLPKHNKLYVISSGKNGIGEQENTGKTPRGWHRIAQKIGDDAPKNSVFIARQATGEIYDQDLAQQFPERDWILSRILWLDGLQAGFNQGDGCDTFKRYIYIHGTPETEPMGIPMSHGCIRMKNDEVIELFELISEQALVYISEHALDESTIKSERSV
ncbi:cell wall-recycling L,D-carboxypeptidase ElsL [Acinetobacter haemolyticus]|uniref:L,D-transpeptidase n=1 Tax=Acinetobacter haemolyticus TaxID=29430 RepID=A0A1L6KKB7_ACIHA|nr:cell wall-recycling L,D-carboxypeptidase ElsL [Acinetobacter haemolyticus]APR69536.1 L,D-transpeptidase [Acinetobacter haemolyticus]NAR87978.1 L,D-transpeptidase family protein [Acinetobacter haemolyticus]NAR94528.1 L,D-transpeptidase family protein [Acinetobacter haemolyticus]NAS07239.1 L,D-transpeptidase family protein [Acinetobacter haemolyticus]NCU22185.1 L,D-transpeptidase [Acinetobacter haemolyticus]